MDNFVKDFRDCNVMRSNGAPCYSEIRLGEAKQSKEGGEPRQKIS